MLQSCSIVAACGLAALIQALSGCGDSGSRAPATSGDRAMVRADSAGRTVLAEVNGAPVYADCVTRRVASAGMALRAALDRCIELELLAQEAHRRGFQKHPDVLAMARKEAVRALLDQQIVAPMPTVEQTDRKVLEDAYKRYRSKIYAPERRRVFHLFAPFGKHRERPGTDDDKRARAFADELYAALAQRRELTPDTLYELAKEVAGERPLGPTDEQTGEFKREIFKVYRDQPNLPRGFSHAAMDIPEPGMISPPARSDYGWHLILYLDGEPAKFANVEQSADYLFQAVRSERFWNFTGGLLKGADVAVAESVLERLQENEDALLGSGASPARANTGVAP